jgi:hypothetical protein
LALFVEFDDRENLAITVHSLTRLWQATQDASLPAALAQLLQVSLAEAQQVLDQLANEGGQ